MLGCILAWKRENRGIVHPLRVLEKKKMEWKTWNAMTLMKTKTTTWFNRDEGVSNELVITVVWVKIEEAREDKVYLMREKGRWRPTRKRKKWRVSDKEKKWTRKFSFFLLMDFLVDIYWHFFMSIMHISFIDKFTDNFFLVMHILFNDVFFRR